VHFGTLLEEHNWTLLRNIWGATTEEVREGRQLHNVELRGVVYIVHISGVMRSGRMRRSGACSTDGQRGNVDRALVGKPEGNRSGT